MHQRSCRVIDDMEEELQQQMKDALNDQVYEDSAQSVENVAPSLNSEESYPYLKKGIKLPKSPLQWSIANDFFQLTLSNYPITMQEINKSINTMTTVIYNYFGETYSFVEVNNDAEFETKYQSCTAKDLKKALKKLKSENGNLLEIKFVAKKLRNLLSKAVTEQQHADINASDKVDHNDLINKNFWGYVKKVFKKKLIHYQHLITHNAQLILQKHFLLLFQIKHLKRGYSPFCASVLLITKVGHQI